VACYDVSKRNKPRAGLLQPLPIPKQTWGSITSGKAIIVVVISKLIIS